MAFVPYDKFDIITKLTPDQILERLLLNVEAKQRFSLFGNKQSSTIYQGYVYPHEFTIVRKINYRNSFNPEIKGTITPEGDICRIRIVMKLNLAVIIFMCVWMGGIFAAAIAIIASQFEKGKFEPTSIVILLMFLFGYVLATGGFKFESGDSKRFLQNLFDAEEI